MEKDQDQKHICMVCGKSCSSGNSLGGHMRSHAAKKAEVHNGKLAFVQNDDAYVTSKEAKVPVKVSVEEKSAAFNTSDIKCKEWGKEFPSVRALCGHMRWHTVKIKDENHVCRDCGKEFDTERALYGHMTHHSRKFRASNDYIQSDYEDEVNEDLYSSRFFSSFYDIDRDEVEEAAMMLMMLSQGITQRLSPDLVLEKREGERLISNVGNKKQSKMTRRTKLASWVTSSSFTFEKENAECDADIDVSDDEFDQDDDSGNEFSCVEIKNGKRKRVEPGKTSKFLKLEGEDNSAEVKSKGLKKIKCHTCRICSKVFETRKGLGGHKKAHKNDVFENNNKPLLISSLAC